MADAASKALGEASAQTGVAPGALAGGALGGALGVLEQKNLARPVTMMGEALSAAQGALSPPGGGGLTSGEKWAAKTGYGAGAGTVQDVSSRYQRSAGSGPVSGPMAKKWGVALPGEDPQLAQRLIDRSKVSGQIGRAHV